VPIQHIHTYLVHPGRGIKDPNAVNGATVKLTGSMFNLLDGIYHRAEEECVLDIIFKSNNGVQQNDCRDLVCAYVGNPTIDTGRAIAERLQVYTDRRPGLGLLFLIVGKEGRDHKIVLSRFPTDSAILVEENPKSLDVEFLERVFMKNKASYKAVLYRHGSLRAGFWEGKAIDKQSSIDRETADYWTADFLLSDFTVTPKQGTSRLATALRDAMKASDIEIKQEIVSAATLVGALPPQSLSINDFISRFNLSPQAADVVRQQLKNPATADQHFYFSSPDFKNVLAYQSVELSNGAMLTSLSGKFDEVFEQQVVDEAKNEVRFSTQGSVVNAQLKRRA
jgi:hypothetical protein